VRGSVLERPTPQQIASSESEARANPARASVFSPPGAQRGIDRLGSRLGFVPGHRASLLDRIDLIDPIDLVDLAVIGINAVTAVNEVNEVNAVHLIASAWFPGRPAGRAAPIFPA